MKSIAPTTARTKSARDKGPGNSAPEGPQIQPADASPTRPEALAPFVPPRSRQDALRESLPATIELLERRRACEIGDGFIDDYVALRWLEWHGGTLRLTITGRNVCSQVSGRSL
jgi:hypothetical protein